VPALIIKLCEHHDFRHFQIRVNRLQTTPLLSTSPIVTDFIQRCYHMNTHIAAACTTLYILCGVSCLADPVFFTFTVNTSGCFCGADSMTVRNII
jgi:hypothetical protein